MLSNPRYCLLQNLQLMEYKKAWLYQQHLVQERLIDPVREDILVLVEHPPVYTLGTASSLDFIKFDPQSKDYELHRIERGGEVTYHSPGQLVGYPIMNLRFYKQDLHWYLRQLEETIIVTLASYNLEAYRIPGLTGVWLADKKIAAIGIKVKKWITMHGFAINVCPNLQGFERIVPCGITDKSVGSLTEFIPEITVEQVRKDLAKAFIKVFRVKLIV